MNPVHVVSTLCAALFISSATAQFDNSVHTYTVNGEQVSLACGGQGGGPVVVFVGGPTSYPVAMSVFESVFPDVNQYARSCSYDTPGTGMSDPAPSIFNGTQQLTLFHGVLAQAAC